MSPCATSILRRYAGAPYSKETRCSIALPVLRTVPTPQHYRSEHMYCNIEHLYSAGMATWHPSEVSDTVQRRPGWCQTQCAAVSDPGCSTLTRTRIHPHSHTPRETCRPGRPARIIPGLWSLSVCRSGCAPKYRLPISPAQMLPVRPRSRTGVCTGTRSLGAQRPVAAVRAMYGVRGGA